MRPAHTIFTPRGAGATELLFGTDVPYRTQKEHAKELQHTGYGSGGLVQIWTDPGAFGEPGFVCYKVPALKQPAAAAPEPKPTKKKLLFT